jgi:predicted ATP-grasp superfamily ATP-dependent carboligase
MSRRRPEYGFRAMPSPAASPALVMGDLDVVRPLVAGGVRCSVFTTPRDPARASRLVDEKLPWIDHRAEPERVVALVEAFAERQPAPPVLFAQTDPDLLILSRHRERLSRTCRLLLPPAERVEELVDKARFRRLAERLGLPVPRSAAIAPGERLDAAGVSPPLIVKPLTWSPRWRAVVPMGKALQVDDRAELEAVSERVRAAGIAVLAQEVVPGPESRIESYHAYVDASGKLVGEFAGRKIRTWPVRFGDSCAVEITDAADVLALGRGIVERLELVGLVKLDFKRAPDGTLWLLEVNPRANLWHHPGAAAGVNLPLLMWADLAGAPRPPVRRARPGVRWCQPMRDARSALASGIPPHRWLAFVRRCETRSEVAWDDPLPGLARVLAAIRARL